jgi:hypothetical protein
MVQMDRDNLFQTPSVLENDSLHKAVILWDKDAEIKTPKHFVGTYDGISF